MKKVFFSLSLLLIASRVLATSTPEIIISEIMYNPAGADSDHEWVEILNVSTSTDYVIDLNWKFNDGSNHQLNVIQGDNVISPQEFLVLVDDQEVFLQDYPDFQGSLIDTVMSLNNSEDILSLSINNGESFFSTTTYQSAWGANDNGFSLELINQDWQESLTASGTPGYIINQIEISTSTPNNIEDATTTPEVIEEEVATTTEEIIEEELSTTTQKIVEEEVFSNQIIINEILPNPESSDTDDEWIELYNRSSVSVDLNSWKLSDKTSRNYTINQSDYPITIIEAFGYFVIYRKESGIALNNDNDVIELYQPEGNLLEQIEYTDSAKDNWSYAKSGGSWQWTIEPTPGYQNIIKSSEVGFQCPAQQIVYVTKEIEVTTSSTEPILESTVFNPDNYQGLRINEFLPNPIGSDNAEWIELYNDSNQILNLENLYLDDEDGGSWAYSLSASPTLPAYTYLIIKKENSELALNNDTDAVRLLGPDKQILQTVVYQGVKEDWSYNYDFVNQEWFWSASTTPGQANIISQILIDKNQDEIVSKEKGIIYSIAELKNLEKGTQVQTVGVVLSLPNTLGKNIFYISEADLSSGIQVYASTVEIPDITLGSLILVHGKTSEVQGEKRINLLKDSQIEIIDKLELFQPSLIAIDDLNNEMVGNLIYVSGELVEKKSSNYYLDDGTAEIRMYIKNTTNITKPKVEEGYYMDVIGILTLTQSGYRLLPRFQTDINVGQILGEVEEVELSNEVIITEPNNQQENVLKYSVYGGGSLMAVLLSLLIKLKFIK